MNLWKICVVLFSANVVQKEINKRKYSSTTTIQLKLNQLNGIERTFRYSFVLRFVLCATEYRINNTHSHDDG